MLKFKINFYNENDFINVALGVIILGTSPNPCADLAIFAQCKFPRMGYLPLFKIGGPYVVQKPDKRLTLFGRLRPRKHKQIIV